MKDNHTGGGKTARNSRKIAILLLLFVLIQTIGEKFTVWSDISEALYSDIAP